MASVYFKVWWNKQASYSGSHSQEILECLRLERLRLVWGACPFHACFNSQKMTVGSVTSKIVGFRFSSTSFVCLISNGIYTLYHIICVNQSIISIQLVYCVTTCFKFGMRIDVLAPRIGTNFPQYDVVVRNWRHAHHIPEMILKTR